MEKILRDGRGVGYKAKGVMKRIKTSYAVIGAGAAGLVVAQGLAKANRQVLLIDRGSWGGDCTNFGCIPSKTLLSRAHDLFRVQGSVCVDVETYAQQSLHLVRQIVAKMRVDEEPEALRRAGIETLEGQACFMGPRIVLVRGVAHEVTVEAEVFVIATGSTPSMPEIEGLDEVEVLTNETVFSLPQVPKTLAIVGGGPIGVEMAQALRRLGSEVTLLQSQEHLLPREEPRAQELLAQILRDEGVDLERGVKVQRVREKGEGVELFWLPQEGVDLVSKSFDALLVATGRHVALDSLGLDKAGVAYTHEGIAIDRYGRTSNPHIYAAGDVTGPPFFTHRCEMQARGVLWNLLSPIRAKLSSQPMPRVTFTDPEIASCGLSHREAIEKYGQSRIQVYELPMERVDRAWTQRQTQGFVRLVTKKWSGKILGVTIMAPRAGEMLPEITLAMRHGIRVQALSTLVHPYPTWSHSLRLTADLYVVQTVLPAVKKWLGWIF